MLLQESIAERVKLRNQEKTGHGLKILAPDFQYW